MGTILQWRQKIFREAHASVFIFINLGSASLHTLNSGQQNIMHNASIQPSGVLVIVGIQQAIAQVLLPIFEPQFAEPSYGFRPKRSAHDALRKCEEYANQGYTYVVDMNLEKFFDTVNQSKMIELLSNTIKDGRVVSLLHKYLTAGAMNMIYLNISL